MNWMEFLDSVEIKQNPPEVLSPPLRALWYERKGDWEEAHQTAQSDESSDAAWVHAYLHRKEGDRGNARYWYHRADRPESRDTLDQEWENIARQLLKLGDPSEL